MKLLYFQNEAWEEEIVRKALLDWEVVFYPKRLEDYPNLRDETADVISIFVSNKIGPAELDRFPALKMITTRSTGFDHIDLTAATSRGIKVCNVPSYGENTVAEFAFALLLTLSRKIYDAYQRIEERSDFSTTGLRGFDLAGKTIGVIGTGKIGRHAITIAQGFGMKVIAYDKFPDQSLAQQSGFTYLSLPELLAQSDVITLHAPYTPETHHLINGETVKKIKAGAYLINTSRGGLVETAALITALKEGILAGAGLDVLEEEGYLINEDSLLTAEHPALESLRVTLENHYLMEHPKVIITPHNAFNTQEAIQRIVDTTIDNIKGYRAGMIINEVANKD